MKPKKEKFLIALGAILAVLLSIFYLGYVEDKIYDESTSHLNEVYDQINREFLSLAEHNWKLLSDWSLYIQHFEGKDGAEQLREFIKNGQIKRKFSDFYFIDQEGNYESLKGEKGQLDIGNQLEELMGQQKNVVSDIKDSKGNKLTLFAVPVSEGKFDGFPYRAIALSYTNEDMAKLLDVTAFSKKVECFVVHSDGGVIFSTGKEDETQSNFLSMLEEKKALSKGKLKNLTRNIKAGNRGTVKYKIKGKKYYLTYLPIGIQEWMLIGSVPEATVNSNMNKITRLTIIIVTFLVLFIAVGIFLYYQRINQSILRKKDIEIQYREQLFTLLVENTTEIYAMFSPKDYRVEYISPNIEQLLGISPQDVLKDLKALKHTQLEDFDFTWSDIDALGLGETMEVERERMHAKTKERRWYKEKLYRLNLKEQDKFLLVMSDCTEDKRLRSQLEQALDIAKAANEAKSSFLSNMSHDIRTPMNAIIGFSHLLARDAENLEKVREYTHKISTSGQHLLGLINEVLDMSKIESGKTTLMLKEFSLVEMVEELNLITQPLAKAKQQTFDIYTTGVTEEKLIGDVVRVKQILSNLLSNAIKYTEEGGRVQLSINQLDHIEGKNVYLRFEVSDNGIGMSQEYLEKIFEPFTRETDSKVNKVQGTGLGMSIAKNLVELMGGTIKVTSEKGKGSTFVVGLEFPSVSHSEDQAFWEEYGISRILVVDDEEDICKNVSELLLIETGVNAEYALQGSSAVEMVSKAHEEKSDYDIILLDWEIPKMDGVETARQIHRLVGKEVTILALTAYDWSDIEEEAKEAGVTAFVQKPFFLSNFRATIAKLKEDVVKIGEEHIAERGFEGLRFLVAEDNDLNAEIIEELLEMEGAQSVLACNGKEALELFEGSSEGYFDAILMDVQMPIMLGTEATRRIRQSSHPQASTIKIIAMTANAFAEDIEHNLESGMDAHLSKPINIENLKKTVLSLLKEKSERKGKSL